jgi:hypothetical protein
MSRTKEESFLRYSVKHFAACICAASLIVWGLSFVMPPDGQLASWWHYPVVVLATVLLVHVPAFMTMGFVVLVDKFYRRRGMQLPCCHLDELIIDMVRRAGK